MKTSQTKPVCFLFLGLIIYALFNAAQAGTQPSVTVQSYAKHVGNNTVYTYQVTNHGPDRLFDFHIGCICTNADDTHSEPQLVIYPVDYDFDYGELGRTSKGSYSAPAGGVG